MLTTFLQGMSSRDRQCSWQTRSIMRAFYVRRLCRCRHNCAPCWFATVARSGILSSSSSSSSKNESFPFFLLTARLPHLLPLTQKSTSPEPKLMHAHIVNTLGKLNFPWPLSYLFLLHIALCPTAAYSQNIHNVKLIKAILSGAGGRRWRQRRREITSFVPEIRWSQVVDCRWQKTRTACATTTEGNIIQLTVTFTTCEIFKIYRQAISSVRLMFVERLLFPSTTYMNEFWATLFV